MRSGGRASYSRPVTWVESFTFSLLWSAARIVLRAQSNLAVNGSLTVNQKFDETYTLTAYGPGGQTVSATISVAVQ